MTWHAKSSEGANKTMPHVKMMQQAHEIKAHKKVTHHSNLIGQRKFIFIMTLSFSKTINRGLIIQKKKPQNSNK